MHREQHPRVCRQSQWERRERSGSYLFVVNLNLLSMISKTLLADEKGHSPDLRTPCDRSSAVLFWAEFFDFNSQTFLTSAVLQLIIPSVNFRHSYTV